MSEVDRSIRRGHIDPFRRRADHPGAGEAGASGKHLYTAELLPPDQWLMLTSHPVPGLRTAGDQISPSDGQAPPRHSLSSHLARVDELLDRRIAELERNWTTARSMAHPADEEIGLGISAGVCEDQGRAGLSTSIDLAQLLSDLIRSGGKRIRPTLSFLGACWLLS